MNISGPEGAVIDGLASRQQCRMIPMIEPDTDEPLVRAGGGDQTIDFCDRPRGGLLDEDMLAGFERADRDWRQRVVGGRHNDDVHIVCARQHPASGRALGRRSIAASARRAIGHGVGTDRERGARRAQQRACGQSGRIRRSRPAAGGVSDPPRSGHGLSARCDEACRRRFVRGRRGASRVSPTDPRRRSAVGR